MEKIAPNVYVSTEYPGVNVGCILTPAGVVAVDAPTLPGDALAWRQQIEAAGGPVLYVVLTDAHPDRLLSAKLLEAPIVAARASYERASAYTDGFWRGVVDGWARCCPDAADDLAGTHIALPEILFTSSITLRKGGMDVTVGAIAGAAPGSAHIYLREPDILFIGDTLVAGTHPYLAAASNTKAWLKTLRTLRRARFSKTTIVPGRGSLCDQSATRPLSQYIVLARRRVRSLHTAGMARVDTATLVAELLPLFPVSEDERELVQRRIKAGLDRLYGELGPV
ncbi:MAG: MBL fold metallo-hydrolase [Chloroflexota bacterium]|nr:MBL fold metallo-hydrolase [Chloroflexota bacterium]